MLLYEAVEVAEHWWRPLLLIQWAYAEGGCTAGGSSLAKIVYRRHVFGPPRHFVICEDGAQAG